MASLADQVVLEIRDGIRHRRYVPGEVYSVYQLSESLGFSRSPVREAMLRLAEAGLVEISRNRGFRVLLPQARDLAEIFAVRLALEVPAAGRMALSPDQADELAACLHALETAPDDESFWAEDRRLHELILVGAGNRRAARIVAGLRETTSLLGEPTHRTHADICAEHRPIVEAIIAGERGAAEKAMHDHLRSTALLLIAEAMSDHVDSRAVQGLWRSVALSYQGSTEPS